ncbi:carbohydrate-binding protein [Pontiellaceae bacterium B12227]|nr:carbohydrate-binding protein [Pontiellaceae bacterium B12227]
MRVLIKTLALTVILLVGAESATAVSFTNDLTDEASVATDFNEYHSSHNNSDWSYTNDYALAQDGTTNTFLEGGAVLDWGSGGDTDTARSYLGTVYSNWMGHSWTAHVAIEAPSGTQPYIFFGLGDPTPNEGYHNEPQNGQSVFVYWRSGQSSSKVSVKLNGGTVTNTGAWQGDPGYDIYMTYNHTNKTVQFEVDNWSGNTRDFGTDIDVDCGEISVDGLLTDTNKMHIFFGANAKVTFRDFDVSETVEVPESSPPRWFTVEAEDRNAQSGTQLEACSDTGGGQNVSHISDGNWCMYEDIALGSDDALLKLRVARPDTTSNAYIEVRLDATDGPLLGQVDVPVTGGWQSWETLYLPVSVTGGTNDVFLVFHETTNVVGGSLFNVNWWSRAPLVEAEDYDDGVGKWFESTADTGGGQNLGRIDAGEWMEYTINAETTGLHRIDFRVAANGGGEGIAVVIDGETNAVMSVADTGGWQVWETQSVYVEFSETGEQSLRLEFLSGGFNLNWFSYESFTAGDATPLTVGTSRNQMLRLGLDYERLWYWYGSQVEPVPEWSVNDCNIDYLRTAMNSGYELEEGTYDLSAYTSKIIPMMTAMQEANPNIKWFASPRPLNEAYPNKKWNGSNVTWQPYPIWVTGATTPISGDYDFNATKCAEYMIRYLLLMKSYGFKITYMDFTNEWQDYYASGGRFAPDDAVTIRQSFTNYLANPWPHPELDPGLLLEEEDFPLMIAPSADRYTQGGWWIDRLTTDARRDAVDIGACHNTRKDGSAEEFAADVRAALGNDAEIWETEQHGWKSTDSANEVTSFYYYMESIRAGFTGINGWLAIGTPNQGHSYLLNNGTTVTRNVKYYIFKKLSTTSNYGYALDSDELPGLESSTMALVRDNLLTVWVNNTSSSSELVDIDFSGHVRDGSPITCTRWNESLSVEGVEGTPISSDSSSFLAAIEGESLYCFEIPLVDNEDNFPFVQAENHDAQTGVSILPCSDTDGGDMVAFSDANDEIIFDLDVTKTYSFGIGFRVSSASADIAFDIYDGTTLLGSVDQPATGGAQNWTTVYKGLKLDGGPMNLRIVATSGGWNLNWIEFEQGGVPTAPLGLYSTLGKLTVALDWDAVDGAVSYDVKRSTNKWSGYAAIGSTTDLSYTDTDVEEGQTYYYVVSAINKYGVGPHSDEVSGYGLPYEIIGPASSYAGSRPDLEKDNLFDKDVDTFYDTTHNNSWAGLDFGEGNQQQITQVDYVLRDWTYSYARATNATFEAANSADFSDAVILFTVTPDVQTHPAVNAEVIADPNGYRYVRLKAPEGKALYTFAELEITTAAVTANGTPIAWLEGYDLTSADDALDSDGDGLLNWEEYLAGTVPTNSGSVLEVNSVRDSASGMVVTWKSVEGISYSIITNGSLVAPNKGTAAFGIIGVDGETSHTTTVNNASSLFYEVGVE